MLQRQKELGIRLAIGATAGEIARCVTLRTFAVVLAGAAVGIGLSFAGARTMEALFYQVRSTEWTMVALPAGVMLGVTLLPLGAASDPCATD